MWKAVDANWGDILKAFLGHQEHKMYDSEGNLVDSNRPMVESMVDDKIHRRGSFWFYMELLFHDTSITRDGHNIYVSCGNPLPLCGGGAEELVNAEFNDDTHTDS